MSAYSQEIEVGPIRVDTGNDWMDFWFVITLIVVVAVVVEIARRARNGRY